MTTFRLRVVDPTGRRQTVELGGPTSADAVRRAAQLGMVVMAIESSTPLSPAQGRGGPAGLSLTLFCQELLALLEAGLNLKEALGTLVHKESQPEVARLLAQVDAEIAKGRNVSDVLEDHPQAFPAVFVALVRAAERTGDLPRALARYIAYRLQLEQIRRRVVAAGIYPALLLTVGTAVTLFLMAYVVPRFASVYVSSGRELPALSVALLQSGAFLQRHALPIGVALAAAAVLGVAAIRRSGWDGVGALVARLPGLARRAEQFQQARLYRALGLLVSSGVPLARALGMVDGLLDGPRRARLARVRELVSQGQPLTRALAAHGLASAVAASLLAVGERSGQLADMLERSARFHDDELERWIDWATRLLEPVLMLLIGFVVGGVVLLLYMPIFDLAGGLQ